MSAQWQRVAVGVLAGAVAVGLLVASLFGIAGRWDWIGGWSYVGLATVGETARTLYLWRKSPGLLVRRGRIGAGTKAWDKVVLGLFGLAYLGILAVAAADERHGWSAMSGWLWPVGLLLYAVHVAILTAAMAVNPYFEKTVRIQHERGHRVIDSGPYRVIRHPGYLATILGLIFSAPLLLGSWWAFLPACGAALLLVVRTALEDRTLRLELAGYEEYVRRVRFRLVPGVW